MQEIPPVNVVGRSFLLLRALNSRPKSTLDLLSADTGLAKSTICRMLQAFQAEGLVRHTHYGVYYLTSAVAELSIGYKGEPKIIEAGTAIADKLTHDVLWPVSIGVPNDTPGMSMCYTTSAQSPVSFRELSAGFQMSLVSHAMGRAYLAHCTKSKRTELLDALTLASHEESLQVSDGPHISAILADVRRKGYALRDPRLRPDSSSIAVPIFEKHLVVGSLGLTWFSSTMSADEAIRRYMPRLRAAAEAISENLGQLPSR